MFWLLGADGVSRVKGDGGSRKGSRGWRNCALHTISYWKSQMAVAVLTERSNGAKDMALIEVL